MRYACRAVEALGCLVLLAASVMVARADTTVGELEPATGTWRVDRGYNWATRVCSASSEAEALACAAADAEQRAADTRYRISYPNRYATVDYTPPGDREPPSAPATISATASSATQVTVAWGAAADNVGVVGSAIEHCAGQDCVAFLEVYRGGGPRQYAHTVLTGSTNRYRVRAYDAAGNLGAYSPIASATTVLPGTITLRWLPPTQNTNGSALTNLAGYRISYGTSSTMLDKTLQVAQPALSTYVMEGLAPGTWYFAVRAYTTQDRESDPSNITSKVVQ